MAEKKAEKNDADGKKVVVMCGKYKEDGAEGARKTGLSFDGRDLKKAPVCDTSLELGFCGDRKVTHLIIDDFNWDNTCTIALQAAAAGIEVVVLSNDASPEVLKEARIAVVKPDDSAGIARYLTVDTRERRMLSEAKGVFVLKQAVRGLTTASGVATSLTDCRRGYAGQ